MTPWELAQSKSEHAEQRALFAWANCVAFHGFDIANDARGYSVVGRDDLVAEMVAKQWKPSRAIPELAFMFAIPNGGSRGDNKQSRMIRGNQLKNEGVRAGVPDIMLPVARHSPAVAFSMNGLFIEMKKESRRHHQNAASNMQKEWHKYLIGAGYKVAICYNWQEAANAIQDYMA